MPGVFNSRENYEYWNDLYNKKMEEIEKAENNDLGFMEQPSHREHSLRQLYSAIKLCRLGMMKYKLSQLKKKDEVREEVE